MSNEEPLLFPLTNGSGADLLAMVTQRCYRPHGSRLVPVEAGAPDHFEWRSGETATTASERTAALAMDRFVAAKPSTDVILCGSAHSRGRSVKVLDTGLSVGGLRKRIRAWGDRQIEVDGSGALRFTEPEPMTSVPIVWERAYGGRDHFAEERDGAASFARGKLGEAISYPRNPLGCGFALDIERGRFRGQRAPNLEDPEDPVTPGRLLAQNPLDWLNRPVAACYEPVGSFTFPRVAFFFAPLFEPADGQAFEVRKGAMRPDDLAARRALAAPDARFQCCAPVGLSGSRLQGGERVSLWHLHSKHELVEFDLPGERPRLLLEPPGCRIYELPPVLQTVLVEPDEERVTLTWAGTLEVAAPYPEEMCDAMRKAVTWHQ